MVFDNDERFPSDTNPTTDTDLTSGEGRTSDTNPTTLAQISTVAGSVLSLIHGGTGAGKIEVPKPFSEPICLIPETRVAGTAHVEDIDEIAEDLEEGVHLRFERDATNRYDRWAIRVYDGKDRRMGFVAADVNEIPARLMDAGKRVFGKVTDVKLLGSWYKIEMAVYLDD